LHAIPGVGEEATAEPCLTREKGPGAVAKKKNSALIARRRDRFLAESSPAGDLTGNVRLANAMCIFSTYSLPGLQQYAVE